MMKKTRILGVLLALCLACSLFAPTAAAAGTFADVPADAFYADAVDWAVDKQITKGTAANSFSPNNSCTRAEMVTFLFRLAGSHSMNVKNPFQDVQSGTYYYDAVVWASAMGITSGVSATEFAPNATVTRGQAVTMLYRYAGSPPANAPVPFRDVPANAFYKDAVSWGKETGVVLGTSSTTFSPDEPCTRAQIVTFLYRFMGGENTTAIPKYPVVLVHGLLGWGSYDQINSIVPYWGFTSGAIAPYLREKGVEVYEASMGPVSSAWDSVCELYAQLSGTVVDYGAKHSLEHGHARYGRDYTGNGQYSKLLNGPWDAQHPINLVGHSFGGVRSRLLVELLANGSAEEKAYMRMHPEAGVISPLFTGGKANWVYSVTMLDAPSNGTTFIETSEWFTDSFEGLSRDLAKMLGLTPFKGIYDFQLEHFGIQPDPNADLPTALHEVLTSTFVDHHDSAYQDLTIDRAMWINKDITMPSNVYWFSYYGNRTYYDRDLGYYVPTNRMQFLAAHFGAKMGQYVGTTEGVFPYGYGSYERQIRVTPTYTGVEWQPNTGLVNPMSSRWPAHYVNGVWVDDPHVNVCYCTTNAQRGVWNVFPRGDMDHLSYMGGLLSETTVDTRAFYDLLIAGIANCGG